MIRTATPRQLQRGGTCTSLVNRHCGRTGRLSYSQGRGFTALVSAGWRCVSLATPRQGHTNTTDRRIHTRIATAALDVGACPASAATEDTTAASPLPSPTAPSTASVSRQAPAPGSRSKVRRLNTFKQNTLSNFKSETSGGIAASVNSFNPSSSQAWTRGLHTISSSSRALTSSRRHTSITKIENYSSSSPKMYTASFAFFESLWDAGVTHCFVNLGSDHPSIIEAMVKGQREKKGKFPRIITCPNEMVAMSMADGYARLTGKPQCVIVHVDVGTQGLGAAVHNASAGRAPILLFAGLSPFTQEGELRGSRTEYIHWIQDVPDQKQIVSQYCRYSAELKTGVNVKQMVNRALQFARSDPQGPVYLCGAREVMEADIEPYSLKQEDWEPVELGGLPSRAVDAIATALAGAKEPLLITGYAGRNHAIPPALVKLANTVKGLRVLDTGGSDMCFPADHPAWLGLRYGSEPFIKSADVIVVVDCDVPWIPTQCKPRADAKIFHIDVDPLKQMMPLFYVAAQKRYRADALTSIEQITSRLEKADGDLSVQLSGSEREEKWNTLQAEHKQRLDTIVSKTGALEDGGFGTGHLCSKLRELCPKDTIWAVEAVTNTAFAHDALQPTIPGSWINCGGGGLGWSGGGALGIKMASDYEAELKGEKGKFVVQIVGDGTYLFSVPGSVYWIARRYNIPVLTIVLNNKGWNAPRKSLLLVHPDGEGSKVSNEEINISFHPVPDFAGIAKAAAGGELHTAKVDRAGELEEVLKKAIEVVQGGQAAVLDCKVTLGC